jgi:hypothetical protein
MIGQGLQRSQVAEALEAGVIVVVDEAVKEGVALFVGVELVLALVPGDAGLGMGWPGRDGG